MARNGNAGSATSSASVRVMQKRARRGNTDWVPLAKLQSDLERGVAFFWSNRPAAARPNGAFNRFDGVPKEGAK